MPAWQQAVGAELRAISRDSSTASIERRVADEGVGSWSFRCRGAQVAAGLRRPGKPTTKAAQKQGVARSLRVAVGRTRCPAGEEQVRTRCPRSTAVNCRTQAESLMRVPGVTDPGTKKAAPTFLTKDRAQPDTMWGTVGLADSLRSSRSSALLCLTDAAAAPGRQRRRARPSSSIGE